VARDLTALAARRGKPGMTVFDPGTELASNAILARSKDHEVEWHDIEPGRPLLDPRPTAYNPPGL